MTRLITLRVGPWPEGFPLIDTFQAIVVTGLAVLPGALYTWSFEREVGNWVSASPIDCPDSSGSHRCFTPCSRSRNPGVVAISPSSVDGSSGFRNLLWEGGALPAWLALVPIAYVGIPMIAGFMTARGTRRGARWPRYLIGRNPAPRAWDRLFWQDPAFLVRAQLRNESWVGGLFSADSYASGYPEPQDLLLEETYGMEPDGSFSEGEDGDLVRLGSGILLSWEDVHFLEVFPQDEGGS